MDPAKAEAWCRFYDKVLCNTTWPRSAWFAAVEDALEAALPQHSRLLELFQAKVAELSRRERAGTGSHQNTERMDQLEKEIKRLLGMADEAIRQGAEHPAESAEQAAKPGWGLGRMLGVFGVATLLFGVAWSGANYYYELRTADQVARQLQPYIEDLRQTMQDVHADLAARREAIGSLQGQFRDFQDELDQKASLIETAVQEWQRELNKVGAEFEQRLLEQSRGAVQTLGSLHQEADVLGRDLDEVGKSTSSLRARIPALEQQIEGLAEHITSAEFVVERTAKQMAEWDGVTARSVGWSSSTSGAGMEQQAEGRGAIPLRELKTQIALLKSEVDQSRQSLELLNGLFAQELERAELDGVALEDAVRGAQTTERQLRELVTHVSAEVATVQAKVEHVLAGFAKHVEEASQQSWEAVQQAEALVSHGVTRDPYQGEGERTPEEHLVALVARTTAMRAALDQARVNLLGRWEEPDQRKPEGYAALVTDLDRYAEVVEGRVQELLEAVDVIVTQTQPSLPPDP